MALVPLDGCAGREDVGGKAETLARARAAGLPALDGVVLPARAAVDDAELGAALARLGGEAFAVRSSSSAEDRAGASAAGVFESVIGARGVAGVRAAIERVHASGESDAARAYLAAHGISDAPLAVLIQPAIAGGRFGVARSLDGGGFLVEERAAGEPEWGDVHARTIAVAPNESPNRPRKVDLADIELARVLNAASALVGGAAQLEYAIDGARVTLLQARPSVAAPREVFDEAVALEGDWRLDAEHNPEPLSAAQAGLVAFVDALGVGARQRVLGGYLYYERGAPRAWSPIPPSELRRRFDEELAPDCCARLAAVEAGAPLDAALDAFAQVFRRYMGEVSPSLTRARAELDRFLRENFGEPLAAHGALLGGSGGVTVERDQALWELGRGSDAWDDYRARFGMYAPAWDVAVAADDEAPDRARAAAALIARDPQSPVERQRAARKLAETAEAALRAQLDRAQQDAFTSLLEIARAALPVAEDDDVLFFRAQRAVRRALLTVGERLVASSRLDTAADVFELPLELVRKISREDSATENSAENSVPKISVHKISGSERSAREVDLRALAASGRATRLAAARVVPPVAITDGKPRWPLPSGDAVLRGHATFGRARGHAVVVRSPADAPATLPPDAILVVPALLPSLAYLLSAARALVTDHGGANSHGATLAREYGLPAVLGAARATSLPDGAELYVDGAAGRVYLIS